VTRRPGTSWVGELMRQLTHPFGVAAN
jgi:hypothetical protein